MCDWATQSSYVWRHNIGALLRRRERGEVTTPRCVGKVTYDPLSYSSPNVSLSSRRQFVFAAFTKEFISPPFTEQIFHFFIPALSDVRLSFPFEAFLSSLQVTIGSSSAPQSQAPWLFYFVLSAGENCLGGWRSCYAHTVQSMCKLETESSR